jgi:hypothetical protein
MKLLNIHNGFKLGAMSAWYHAAMFFSSFFFTPTGDGGTIQIHGQEINEDLDSSVFYLLRYSHLTMIFTGIIVEALKSYGTRQNTKQDEK